MLSDWNACPHCGAKAISQDSELGRLRAENAAIRVQWGMCYSQGMAYIDDGECSDSRTIPVIDFKRDSVEQILSKMRERAINAMKGK